MIGSTNLRATDLRSGFGPRTLRWVGFTLATLLLGSSALARTPVLSMTGNVAQVETDNLPHLVEFGAGQTTLEFRTFSPGRAVIYFSAECTVGALGTTRWLDIDILVDGLPIAPTNDDNAFCTSRDVQGVISGWVSASADVAMTLAPGLHTIEVEGQLSGIFSAGDAWRLGETTLVVVLAEDDS